jgi:hypothetical protein
MLVENHLERMLKVRYLECKVRKTITLTSTILTPLSCIWGGGGFNVLPGFFAKGGELDQKKWHQIYLLETISNTKMV